MTVWEKFERAYDAGDRKWFPVTEEFYWEMLNVLPPLYKGDWWAVSEIWKHTARNEPVRLWFKGPPEKGFARMATVKEIHAEQHL